jgi:hypothetical protein
LDQGPILNSLESLIRTRHRHDARNPFEGHPFRQLLRAMVGITIGDTLINAFACMTMPTFWIAAL